MRTLHTPSSHFNSMETKRNGKISHCNQKVCMGGSVGKHIFQLSYVPNFYVGIQATGLPFWWLMLHWKSVDYFCPVHFLLNFPDEF